ncbi:MAG: YDG domain-containing protein, partial [Flavisolibacter sp.]
MQPKLSGFSKALILAIIFFAFSFSAIAQATLHTDSSDYHPGSTVIITGSGFTPSETVVLQVTHVTDGNNETSSAHTPWNVVADESGNIAAKWLVPVDQDELGASLLLTANGKVSLLHAERFFTDAIVTVTTANVSWKSLPITPIDLVLIKSGGSLIVDVPDAQCASIKIAGASSDGGMGSGGNGTLIFNAGSQLTVNGIVTLGALDGGTSFTGTLDMTKGGKLVCKGFEKNGKATQKLNPGIGTIELNATNTLLSDFQTFNNLTITAGTTTLKYAGKASGLLNLMTGAVFDLSRLNFRVGSLSGSGSITNATSTGTAKNTFTVGDDSTSTLFSGIISDGPNGWTMELQKSGTGTLTLTGANTYTTNTWISSGTIGIGDNSAISTSTIILGTASSPTLIASGGARTINNDIWISSVTTGKATIGGSNDFVFTGKMINRSGDRTLRITNTGTTTFSGPLLLSESPLSSRFFTFTGTGNLVLNGPIVNCEGGGGSDGKLTFDDAFTGTATINGFNTFSGRTALQNGTFVLGNKNVFGTGTVYLYNVFVSASTELTGLNSITNPIVENGHPTFTGVSSIEFSGGLTNSGSRTLTNNIADGILSITDTIKLSNSSTNYTFTVDGTGTTVITGLISNGGSIASNLLYSGTGTLIFGNSANSLTGTTTINSGELRINPTTASATFASKMILSGGRLTTTNIASNVTWSSSSTLTLSSNSTIDLGSNVHYLKFADSHSVTWAAGTLTINGWTGTGGRIFFGSGPGALTAAQLAKISFAGFSGPAMLLSTGELVPTPQCTGPMINTSPSGQPGNQSITYGDNANFSVAASGTGTLTYNWRVSKDGGYTFSDISGEGFTGYAGATSPSLALTMPTVAMSKYEYECVITNSCGNVTTIAGVLIVNPKTLNVSISASNKEYDGNTNAEVAATNPIPGLVSGDDVNANASNGSFDSKTAGKAKTVTAYISLAGSDANNYLFNSTANATANISPKPLIIQINCPSRSYDGTRNAIVKIQNPIAGLIDGDEVMAVTANGLFDSKDVGLSKSVTAEISLEGADAQNYTFGIKASTTADISPLKITGSFTANDKIYDGNITANVLTRSVTPAIIGDDVSLTGGTAHFQDSKVGDAKLVTLIGATLSGESSNNYSLTAVSTTTANITQRPIAIAANAGNKTYGELDPDFIIQVISGSVVDGEVATGSAMRETGENVGKYQISQGTFSYGSNYAETYVPATFTIDPLEVSVVAAAKTKTYGDNDPAFTYTCLPALGTVLPNKETVAFNGQLLRIEGETVQGSPYRIELGSLLNTNYTIKYTEAVLTIEPAILKVSVDNKSKEYGATLPVLTGSITGVKGSDDITASFNTVATETSDVVPSGYPIAARLNDPLDKLSNYIVNYSPGVLMITKVNPIIDLIGFDGVYDGNQHGAVSTSAKGLADVDLSSLLHLESTTYTNVPGGTLHWDFDGNNNYNSISGEVTVSIKKADAVIKVQGYDVPYDGDLHVATAKALGVEPSATDLTGLLNLSSTAHKDAGEYQSDEWTFAGNTNYNATNGKVQNRISTAASNVTVTVNNSIYDGNPHPATASVTGGGALVQSLEVLYSGIGPTIYGPSNIAPVNAGNYSASASFAGDGNHDGSTDSKTFTIEKANAIITTIPYDVTYDGMEHTAVVTAMGVESIPIDLTGSVDVTYTKHTNAGDYSDDYWSFAGNNNYNSISNTILKDKIGKANSVTTVMINGDPFTYNGTAITPATVTVTGIGGLSLTPLASYKNNTIAGTATASYVFAGDDNHIGSNDSKTFTISKKRLTVTADNKNKIYDGQTFVAGGGTYSVNIMGFAGTETLENSGVVGSAAYAGSATTAVDYGQHVITPTVGTLEAANYNFAFVNGILEIGKRSLDVTGSKIYDGNTSFIAGALVPANVVGSDIVKIEGTATVSNKNVGNYSSFKTSSLSCSSSNYELSGGTVILDITQRPLIVTAAGIDKMYDGNTDATVNLYSNKVTGDELSLSYTRALFNDPNSGTHDIIVNGISVNGNDAGNYSLANSSSRTSAKIIKGSTSSVLKVSAGVVRYMDQVTLTVSVTPVSKATVLTGTVQFKIGSILFGPPVVVVPVPGDPDGTVQATFIGQVTNLPT